VANDILIKLLFVTIIQYKTEMTEWRGMPVFFDHYINPAENQQRSGDMLVENE
jgi:hypothetical protein